MTIEIMSAIGVFIGTSFMTGVFVLIKTQISRVLNRVNHLTACQFAIFDGLKELGVNGDVKKEMNKLKEQVIND